MPATGPRCPGYSPEGFDGEKGDCESFYLIGGETHEERWFKASTTCGNACQRPPLKDGELPDYGESGESDDVEDLIDEIADIINWENAGFTTDWSVYPFEYQILNVVWRFSERQIREIREVKRLGLLRQQNELLKVGLGIEMR